MVKEENKEPEMIPRNLTVAETLSQSLIKDKKPEPSTSPAVLEDKQNKFQVFVMWYNEIQ